MDFKETTLNSQILFNGKIISLKRDEVLLPNGKHSFREVVTHNGGASVICEIDQKICLVKQFRYPYGETVLEIPAGKLNVGEDPKQTAIRELEEECGIKADDVELLFTVYPTPGYTNEKIYIYKATGFTKTKQNLDEGEFVESIWYDKETLNKMIDNGEIKDGKTLIALLWYLRK